MFAHVLTLALLATPADVADHPAKSTPDSEKITIPTFDDMTFTARTVRFRSENGLQTCMLKGSATVKFGDITITADRIQCNGIQRNGEGQFPQSLACTGNCTWQQEGRGEVFCADKLELQRGHLRLSGNASLRYGLGDHSSVMTCDSIVVKHGSEDYEFSGAVRLRRSK